MHKKEKEDQREIRKKYKHTNEKHTGRYNKTKKEGTLKEDSQKFE